jgi:hypothetical protein
MVRALAAEESLRHVTEVAAGMGLIKDHQRNAILNAWRREANMARRRGRTTLDDLVAPGLPMVEVKA